MLTPNFRSNLPHPNIVKEWDYTGFHKPGVRIVTDIISFDLVCVGIKHEAYCKIDGEVLLG